MIDGWKLGKEMSTDRICRSSEVRWRCYRKGKLLFGGERPTTDRLQVEFWETRKDPYLYYIYKPIYSIFTWRNNNHKEPFDSKMFCAN